MYRIAYKHLAPLNFSYYQQISSRSGSICSTVVKYCIEYQPDWAYNGHTIISGLERELRCALDQAGCLAGCRALPILHACKQYVIGTNVDYDMIDLIGVIISISDGTFYAPSPGPRMNNAMLTYLRLKLFGQKVHVNNSCGMSC